MSILALTLIALGQAPAPMDYVEMPVASFTIDNGDLNIEVLYLGVPVEGVQFTIYVGATKYASGEMDELGTLSIPCPNAEYFQVVFDVGCGPSAPIPLAKLKNGTVVPTSTPIRDGTAGCCRIKVNTTETPQIEAPTMSFWQQYELPIGIGVGTIACLVLLILYRIVRRR